jgi:hypothetical protein
MVSRVLLAVMLLAAIGVERYMPTRDNRAGKPRALLVVLLAAYLSAAFPGGAAPSFGGVDFVAPWGLASRCVVLAAAVLSGNA